MKNIIIVIILIQLVASCKKEESSPVITATLQQSGGCLPNTWLVLITNGDASKYSFLCQSSNPTSSLNCSNTAYIVNMPTALAQLGKRIKFSKWKDNGIFCASSTYAPHHLEVTDVSED